jgi:hypothetical protein
MLQTNPVAYVSPVTSSIAPTSIKKNEMIASKKDEIIKRVHMVLSKAMQDFTDANNYIFHLNLESWDLLCQTVFVNNPEISPDEVKNSFELDVIDSKKEVLKECLIHLSRCKEKRLEEKDWEMICQLVFSKDPWISYKKTKDLYEQAMIYPQKENLYRAIANKLAEKTDTDPNIKPCSVSLEDHEWEEICSKFFSPEITIAGVKFSCASLAF